VNSDNDNNNRPYFIFFKDIVGELKNLSSPTARLVYILFLIQLKFKRATMQYSSTEITFPYSEAEKHGIARQTFLDAINQLEDKGFIEINRGGLKHQKSKYNLLKT